MSAMRPLLLSAGLLMTMDVSATSTRVGATRARLGLVREMIEVYRRDHGVPPVSLLAILDGESQWKRQRLLDDAGDNKFIYLVRDKGKLDYDLYSTGGNGRDDLGAGDDVVLAKPSFLPQVIAAAIVGTFVACIVVLMTRHRRPSVAKHTHASMDDV